MLPKDGEGGHWVINPENPNSQIWIPDNDEVDLPDDPFADEEMVDIGGIATNTPSAFQMDAVDHIINWKDEEEVRNFVNPMLTQAAEVFRKTAEAGNWTPQEIAETERDVKGLARHAYEKYVLGEVGEYVSRPEDQCINFIANFIIRWGPVILDHNFQYRQMVQDFCCRGTNYGESYDDYAARVREAYRRKRSASS